jgi:hypothetical protein
MWGAQGDQVAHPSRPAELLNVVAADQPTLGVPHHVDVLQAMVAQQTLDPRCDGARHVLDRKCVEATEQASKVDQIGAVSRPTEPCSEPADGVRGGEKAMQEKQRVFATVKGGVGVRKSHSRCSPAWLTGEHRNGRANAQTRPHAPSSPTVAR